MKKHTLPLIISLIALSLSACEKAKSSSDDDSDNDSTMNQTELNPIEDFAEADAPVEHTHENLSFQSPWGYEKPDNTARNYPILVSGMWGEGLNEYQAVAQRYPAFVIDYQKKSSSDGQALGQWIKSALDAGYRIDTNRIYLTGFSWGGSSSYPIAQGLHNEGMYFAGIIRVAGQSQSDLGDDIAHRTAVWYHIGLEDKETRVQVARDALEYMRNYPCNENAREVSGTDDITGYERSNITLIRSGMPMFKYSEYTGMGHTPGPCYNDTTVFPWLFNNTLQNWPN